MLRLFKFLIIFILCFNFTNFLYASEKIAFIDINYIINNSSKGKKILSNLEKIDEKNRNELDLLQKKIKKENEEIKKIKNVVTKEELTKKIDNHKKNIENFNKKRSALSKSLMDLKKKQTFEIVKQIGPIVEKYMKEKSIDVVLKNETLYISKSNYDITKEILEIVNKEIK
tara:strand:- start:311 stop:823 length:513 start_codon:yes stop_codon:yes gene_type:complete